MTIGHVDRVEPVTHLADGLRAGALGAFVVSAVVFTLFPFIDIDMARLFFTTSHTFAGSDPAVEFVRNLFKGVYITACAVALAGLVYTHLYGRRWFGLTAIQNLFVITCLALGPGIVSNLALKDQWGRARPREIVQFGGERTFSAALIPAHQCNKNCSFVSGEASSMFMVFFAAAFLFPLRSRGLVAVGIAAGALAGLIRMSQGGHFLSDVIFAGIAMALTAVFTYQLFRKIGLGGLGVSAERSA